MKRSHNLCIGILLVLGIVSVAGFPIRAAGPSGLQVSPPAFDFGWCPDNAKITGEFTVKNTGSEMVPLTSVQPTCGCTASQFTPESLSSQEETKISLTFNTRGYANMRFNKSTKVKSDEAHGEVNVNLVGYVLDPSAQVVPVGDGIAAFPPGSKDKSKIIQIENKSANEVKLEIVQAPAGWADVKIKNPVIAPGKTTDLEISIDGSVEQNRDTSLTLAAASSVDINRLTLAIRSGPGPAPYKKYQAPVRIPVRVPAEKPTSPDQKK